jgi:hypothetical protein
MDLLYWSKLVLLGDTSGSIVNYHVDNDGCRASYVFVDRSPDTGQRASKPRSGPES